ncbi:3-methyl-2-oxobutanoate dehydrogenase (2-methylpropanoyl-transferring) [Salvia divinorum]|uniref:3-methyl-2-oxobutanoate dehydrogenase (2-methylpropanoyl-transferring) n=1 Tax=Salvia divinorum TaxID=28513 RepID=A0ABD1G701_SALDI
MALYLSKSGKLLPHFKQKICSLGMISLSSIGSCFSQNPPLSPEDGKTPYAAPAHHPSLFASRRFGSVKAEKLASITNTGDSQALNFPGGIVKFTPELKFLADLPEERIHCYRVLDESGHLLTSDFVEIDKDIAVKMYEDMVMLQTIDTIFYEAQRQGRISFYVTAAGEEAINIASAAALSMDDFVFPQYREAGVLLWRGFGLQDLANQCFGNVGDNCKGRQMPAHYGSKKHNYFTVASTVATQIPHAVGAAYSLKMEGRDACTITYFGDGGTSTGDCHAAMNFAAVLEAPVILFCRNNGWAISTPVSDQFRSDGIVVRGQAYGIRSIRVDGNDALAVFSAVHMARKMAISESRPVLIEALTYRAGHHSTSDDSSKYRPIEEIEWWRAAQDPVARFRKWLEIQGWWRCESDTELRDRARQEVLNAILVAEKTEKPGLGEIFTDVYDFPPSNLRDQEKSLRQTVERHQRDYPHFQL